MPDVTPRPRREERPTRPVLEVDPPDRSVTSASSPPLPGGRGRAPACTYSSPSRSCSSSGWPPPSSGACTRRCSSSATAAGKPSAGRPRPPTSPAPRPRRSPSRPGPRPATRRPRRPTRWLGWALAALALVGCLLLVSPGEIAAALRHLSLPELAALLLLASLDRLLMGLRWGVLLRLAGVRLPLPRAVRLFYQASAVGTLLPSHLGGDLLRGWWAVREGGAGHPVAASLVMERLLGLVSAANWAVLGAVLLAVRHAPEHAWSFAALGVLAALAGNGLFAFSLSRPAHRLVRRGLGRLGGSRPARLVRRFHAAYAVYGRDRRGLWSRPGWRSRSTGCRCCSCSRSRGAWTWRPGRWCCWRRRRCSCWCCGCRWRRTGGAWASCRRWACSGWRGSGRRPRSRSAW